MKNKMIFFVPLIAVFVLLSDISQAQGRGRGFNSDLRPAMYERLDLSEDQIEKLSSIRNDHRKIMIDIRSELQKAQLALRELKEQKSYSRSEFMNAMNQISDVRSKMSNERAEFHMDVYEQLTEDQKQKWSASVGKGMGMGRGENNMGFRQGRRQNRCW